MSYYPVFLDIRERHCVVVGGGTVAAGKVRALLEAGARVRVIAPDLAPELLKLAAAGQIDHSARRYQAGDLAGAFVVICATDDRAVNHLVWQEACAQQILVNVVDDVPHCNFIAPSIVRRGDLVVAISTSGRAPALAVRLREQLEGMLGPEHAAFLALAGALRAPLAEAHPDFEVRKALWYQLVDSDVMALLRAGDDAAARQRVVEVMGVAVP